MYIAQCDVQLRHDFFFQEKLNLVTVMDLRRVPFDHASATVFVSFPSCTAVSAGCL